MSETVETKFIEVPEIEETWTVQEIAQRRPPLGWREVFAKCGDEFRDLSEDIAHRESQEGKFYPLRKHLFRAFEITPLEEVRVVIIGQDPYPQARADGYPRAQGMSFSVGRRDQIPSSLGNIFKEVEQCIPGWERPDHGDLSAWARQGVLLLNMSLTVSPNKPNSYGEIWMQFIVKVLDAINRTNPHCIYVMWGKEAQKLVRYISDKSVQLIAAHPSGFSANRGFLGCGHFSQINEILEKRGQKPIDWSLVDPPVKKRTGIAIEFYCKLTRSIFKDGIRQMATGYNRCCIYREPQAENRGCHGSIQFIRLSDGRLIKTNDLWHEEWVEELPTGVLTGKIWDTRVTQKGDRLSGVRDAGLEQFDGERIHETYIYPE